MGVKLIIVMRRIRRTTEKVVTNQVLIPVSVIVNPVQVSVIEIVSAISEIDDRSVSVEVLSGILPEIGDKILITPVKAGIRDNQKNVTPCSFSRRPTGRCESSPG